MKNALFIVVLLALISNAICQTTDSTITAPLTKEDYLKRAKNQKIAGFVTLGAGIGLIVGGRQLHIIAA